MALTKAAQDYLMAVDREKKKQMARGGQAAADSFVKTQTDKAKYLSGDDSKMQAVAQRRIDASKAKANIEKASEISKGMPNISFKGKPKPVVNSLNPNRGMAGNQPKPKKDKPSKPKPKPVVGNSSGRPMT